MTRPTRNRNVRTRRHMFHPRLHALEERALLSTFVVNTVSDLDVAGGLPAGQESLRQAIEDADADASNPGADTIDFDIPGPGVHTIQPGGAGLPLITRPLVLDGWSQGGPGYTGSPLIELDGGPLGEDGVGATFGLGITASDCTVRGLIINSFTTDRYITDGGFNYYGSAGIASIGPDTLIEGCYIGTDATGTQARANTVGVLLSGAGSRVGSNGDGINDAAERNIISGNLNIGIAAGGSGIVIAGNYIGTDVTGTGPLGNGVGVVLTGPSRLGFDGMAAHPEAQRNVISGNASDGVTAYATSVIAGNYIGLDATGTQALGNGWISARNGNPKAGIELADDVLVGSDGDGVGDEYERNIISGNPTGIIVFGSNNHIAGNYIGTDPAGTYSIGQQGQGVVFYQPESHDNVLGYDSHHPVGDPAGELNVISGNLGWGVSFAYGAHDNTIAGNFIGTDASGTVAVGNQSTGILISGGASYNLIGTNSDGVGDELERNIISGNSSSGIFFGGGGGDDNVVAGNYIGPDVTGQRALGNGGGYGVVFWPSAVGIGNRIGVDGRSADPAAGRNIITGPGAAGVAVGSASVSQTTIAGNDIGTDPTGTRTVDVDGQMYGFGSYGIFIGGATSTIIGTDGDGVGDDLEGNVIGGSGFGLYMAQGSTGQDPTGTVVAGNWIGTNPDGDNLGNGTGIRLDDGTKSTQVGGPRGLGNTIAFNGGDGIIVAGPSTANAIRGNSIHDNGFGISLGADVWQDFPVLSAAYAGASTVVMGTLHSTPNTTFTLDFYANAAPDRNGNFEGQTYLGSTTVTTDASGTASFTATGLAPASLGQRITATATAPSGNTSQFSLGEKVTQALTTTSLTASVNPSLLDQPVTFTATVTTPVTGLGTPTGSVQFIVDGANFGSPVPLNGSVATVSTSTLSVGPHTIQASYSGDSLFLGSSASLTQTVQYRFSGFQAPLNQNLTFALNRTIPIRFNLSDFNNLAITSLGAVTSLQIAAGTASSHGTPFNPASSDKAGLHLEGTTFAFNWQTKGLAAGNYVVLPTLADGTVQTRNLTLSANGASAGLMADGTANTGPTGTGALQGGDLTLYVNNSSGQLTGDELARIDDAVAAVNGVLAPYGVRILETSDSSSADVVIDTSATTAVGGLVDGVLGCETPGPASTEITLVQGWNWYAGSEPTAVGAGQFDFETVVMHELGHALGLGHSADLASVMYATLAAGEARRSLNIADLNVPDADGGTPAGLHVRLLGRVTPIQPLAAMEDGHRIEAELPAALAAIDQALEAWTSTSDPASDFTRSRARTMWLPLGS